MVHSSWKWFKQNTLTFNLPANRLTQRHCFSACICLEDRNNSKTQTSKIMYLYYMPYICLRDKAADVWMSKMKREGKQEQKDGFWMEDLPVHVSPAGHSPFFLALSFIIVTQKAKTHTGMCHCGLCMCLCWVWMCVHMHWCECVHAPMCRPVPVLAECRQTDEGQKERHISFIGLLGVFTVLFWRTCSSCPLCFTMTSHALQYVSLNDSFSPSFCVKAFLP